MDAATYSNLSQGLAQETYDRPAEAQIDDKVEDGKRYLKSALEGLGGQLTTHSLIKKLTGKAGSKAKKALDLSEEEMKDLQSKAESGDFEGAVGKIFKGVIRKGSSKLEQAVNSAVNKGDLPTSKGDLGKAARKAARAAKRALKKKAQPDEAGPAEPEEPQGPEDIREAMNRLLGRNRPIPKQDPQELSPLKSNDSPFSQDDPIQDRPRAPYGKRPAQQQEDRSPEDETEPAKDPDALEPAEKELAKQGEKDLEKQGEKEVEQQVEKKTVEETLKDTAEASTAEDETPIGGVVTAALGVAALVAGLMTHDHKKVWKRPPVQLHTLNYSVQSGVG